MFTGYVWEELYTRHTMGPYHPESPARLFAVKEVLEDVKIAQYLTKLHPRPATKEEIAWVHDKDYIASIEATSGTTAHLDPDTSTSPDSWKAALLAVGGAIACADYSIDHGHSFAFVRPPGHHAERDHAMGFCIFNNIAIAAEHVLKKRGLKKVAIVDFDVHHGNGTQHHFYDRKDVFFASTHRMPFYPGTGGASEKGKGNGADFTLNVPLSGRAGDSEFKAAWKNVIIPAVEKFQPELILVSAGFDAHESDPLGGMSVTTGGFRWLAEALAALAKRVCNKRLTFVLEGGYSLSAIKSCVRATLEEMF